LRHERQYRGGTASRQVGSINERAHVDQEVSMMESHAKVFVGVDWASETHQACAIDPSGKVLGEKAIPHSGTGLGGLCRWLRELAGGRPEDVWVSIEVPHGAVVETLLEGSFVVHSINPKQMDRFRDRFSVAGAKDDRRDAYVLADSLRTDAHCFRRLTVDDPDVIELREWSRMADELQQERNRLCNRFREQLQRYYPQALRLSEDVGAGWYMGVWEKASTPKAARKVRPSSIAAILKRHRIRKVTAGEVVKVLREQPVTVAAGTEAAATAHVRQLIPRIRLVNQQIKECRQHLERLCTTLQGKGSESLGQGGEQRDAAIIRSMPGVGLIVLATLLAEASGPLKHRDYHALRALAGCAPITHRSGKRCLVVMRQACSGRVRNAVYHWARVASQCEPWVKDRYVALRQRGCTHGRALRGVADRLLHVLGAMLRSGTLYDPARRAREPVSGAA
jgi:transposase